MGYMRHHAIVVTSWNVKLLERAFEYARNVGIDVSPIVLAKINGYSSFLAAPDGSKEGWEESSVGDARRHAFIAWMNEQRHEDGSSSLDWAEVQYGDDNNESKVVRHSDDPAERGPSVRRGVAPTEDNK